MIKKFETAAIWSSPTTSNQDSYCQNYGYRDVENILEISFIGEFFIPRLLIVEIRLLVLGAGVSILLITGRQLQ